MDYQKIEQTQMYPFLSKEFLDAMNQIGQYGHEKYGADSFHYRRAHGDHSRGTLERNEPEEIAKHSREHFEAYLHGIQHDRFNTRLHQLAAVAFNAMMEAYYANEVS